MVEGAFRFEGVSPVETAVELGELRAGFGDIVRKGTKEELTGLLEKHPQRSRAGNLIWLLTSGLAVELATGVERSHHDLDVVVMDPNNMWRWEMLGTDNVTPGQYWAKMKFDGKHLEKTSMVTDFATPDGRDYQVEIVHPTIIMVQKFSNAFGRDPRDKDIWDAAKVINWWEKEKKGYAPWINIASSAIYALPINQRGVTVARFEKAVPQILSARN